MAQAFLKFDSVMAKNEEPDHANTPATSFWTQWELTFIGPEVSFNQPLDRLDVGVGMSNSSIQIRVDQGDTAATFGTKVRTAVNQAASARGWSVPANQLLIPSHQRL